MNAKIIVPAIMVPVAIIAIVYVVSLDEPHGPFDCRYKYGKGTPEMFECLEKFHDNAPLPATITLKQDQTTTYRNLTFWFYDIEDSRCPSDVTCVWEGEVKVMIHIRNQTHKISAQFTPNHSVTYIQPYNITLTDIQPYPVSTEKADYTATLEIQNLR